MVLQTNHAKQCKICKLQAVVSPSVTTAEARAAAQTSSKRTAQRIASTSFVFFFFLLNPSLFLVRWLC
jgi:hypothetical protein